MGSLAVERSADLRPVIDDERWQRAVERATNDDALLPLLLRARDRAEDLTDRAVARIVASIPVYADEGIVSRDDLWLSVSRNLDLNLLVLAEHRDLSDEELHARAALGARRAQAGLAVSDLLRAFRVGYLVLWEGLTEVARDVGPATVNQLLDDAGRIWECLDRISNAVAESYREALFRRDVDLRRRALAFVAGLETYPDGAADTEAAARALGIDPSAPLVAAVCGEHIAGFADHGAVVADQPDRTVVILQPGTGSRFGEAQLQARLQEALPSAAGIGTVATGLEGARRSLSEASRAFRVAQATGGGVVCWRDGWFECLVHEARASVEPLVAEAAEELRRSEDGIETLEAVVTENGNLTAAARRLHVHPNTVAYRMQRLKDVSGLDVKGQSGLLLGQLALSLVRLER